METALFASDALLPGGWVKDVRIAWDAQGEIVRVDAGVAPGDAARAPGPVIPGMPNLHSHAFQRAMAGLAEVRGHPTDDFWTWREAMYHLVLTLEPEDVEAIAAQLYVEMLRHGYTSVAEFHYLHHDREGRPYADRAELAHRVIAAAGTSGIAMTLLPVIYQHGGFGHKPLNPAQKRFAGDAESIPALVRDLVDHYRGEPLLRFGIAPHSVRAIDAHTLTDALAAMDGIDALAPIHIHASEQQGEVRECLQTHCATPIDWICDIAPVDKRWCFIHSTHATPAEAARLREHRAVAGLCPTTEANLGDGIFAFETHWREEGRFGVGGDSHVSVSPFDELRALEYSQRLALRVRNVTASESQPDVASNLWNGACQGGAQALGQAVGALMPGRRADLVVLDGDDLDFEGLAAASKLAAALFSGSTNRVRDVYVGGHKVIDAGHHAAEGPVRENFRKTLARLR